MAETNDSIEAVKQQVRTYFSSSAGRYLADSGELTVDYVLNPSDLSKRPFRVGAGRQTYHLKLINDPEDTAKLFRWKALAAELTEKYRAPRVVDWIDLPGGHYSGLLFEYIAGQSVVLKDEPDLFQQVVEVARRLHRDAELASRLEELLGRRTLFDSFHGTFIERFDSDLAGLRDVGFPPFVEPRTAEWMKAETRALDEKAGRHQAFQAWTSSPVHGDLHERNVLLGNDGSWWLIDWDDLELGDPALDFAILLWQQSKEPPSNLPGASSDDSFNERLALHFRALLLNDVIDTLADWDAAKLLGQTDRDQLRADKAAVHRAALAAYSVKYGGPKA